MKRDKRLDKRDRLTLFVPKGKATELKINALKVGMPVSDYVAFIGTASLEEIAKLKLSKSELGAQTPK